MDDPPAADIEAQARTALVNGQAALLAGDNDAAFRWLDRAHRLVPTDPNVMLALASAWISQDTEWAASLFARVAEAHGVAQAWLGLAACRLRQGDGAEALRSLARVLAEHALPVESIGLIDRIAAETGWCGLHSDGRLEIHPPAGHSPAGRHGKPRVTLDGKPVSKLPRHWPLASRVEVRVGDVHLLGSPIRVDVIRRLVGCVEADDGGITGWAWYPNDPATDPALTLRWPDTNRERRIVARDRGRHFPHTGPLAQVRGFAIPPAELLAGPVHILGLDDRPLLGSPLDPRAAEIPVQVPPSRPGPTRPSRASRKGDGPVGPGRDGGGSVQLRTRPATVVVPVHDGGSVVRTCLDSLFAATKDARVVVVDDGSREPDLIAYLDQLAKSRRIRLLRHPVAQGFPAAANAGMRAARGRDVVLLNSDTLLPPDWLPRLRAAAYSARDIGAVSPLSNDATILSYPAEAGKNPVPDQAAVIRLDRLAQRANRDATIDIPVGVGFCLYIRRDCLDAAGPFRAETFAQGYGEENDFCLRARRLGWRSVALPGLFVGHLGGASFGAAAVHLRARNSRILERLHPGHDALIRAWTTRDPLAEARRRIDLLRWRQLRRGESVILVTHDDGGGVEARVAASVRTHRAAGLRPIVLRPVRTAEGEPAIAVHDGIGDDFANLVFAMPAERKALLTLLHSTRPRAVEVHHLVGFGATIYDLLTRLALPQDVFVHDYAWFCARVSLVGRDHYCGEPDVAGCAACVAEHGHFLTEVISPAALRRRSAAFLASANRVVVPSADVGARLRRHFPGVSTVTIPHEDDLALPPPHPPAPGSGRVRVCVVGGIGLHKGYHIVLACARDAEARGLDLEFVVVGNTIDDMQLMATGRVFVTGRFKPAEVDDVIRRQNADLGFVASVWPETWCLTLSDIWRAGLPACAFDFGAPAERIRATGWGFVLPVGLPPAAINDVLITSVRDSRKKMRHTSVSHPTMRHVASGRAHDFAMHAEK